MKHPPLVSVLIPCFNAANYIGDTITSVFAQTWPNIEVVVVNDGSTDESARVIRDFARPNLIFLDQNNRGAAASRNDAFAACSGEFIQWLDADDLISPNKIQSQLNRLQDEEGAIASAAWGRFYSDPAETKFVPDSTWRDLPALDWLAESRLGGHRMMFPALWLIPREIAERAGPWNEDLSLADDTEYFTRILLAAERVLFCEDARACYRSAIPGSLSSLKSTRAWKSAYKVNLLCDEYILNAEDSPRMRRGTSLAWQDFAYSVFPFDQTAAEHAMFRAQQLSPGSIRPPPGGFAFKALARIIGWRAAISFRMLLRER